MEKDIIRCSVCLEKEDSNKVFRITEYEGNQYCDICINETLTEEAPTLLERVNTFGVIIYEDIEKERKYFEDIGVQYIVLGETNDKLSLDEYISDRKIDADTRPEELKSKIKSKKEETTKLVKPHKPKDIFNYLDEHVVKQEEAKKVLSVISYNHYKNIIFKHTDRGSIGKSNTLLIGPTGSGKTYLNTLLADLMRVPFVHVDANSFTIAGYSGGDVEDILEKLYIESDKDLQLAQKGIVLIDEIDKLAFNNRSELGSSGYSIKKRGVQEALLKFIEGGKFKVEIGGSKGPSIDFDTSGVLFILAGAFSDIDKVVEKRLLKDASIGFTSNVSKDKIDPFDLYRKVTHEDLEKYGIIPELIGRISMVAPLHPLKKEDLIEIMTNKKGSLVDSYKSSLAYDDVDLHITDGALESIADYSLSRKTGARGLRQIFDRVLLDLMYEAPSKNKGRVVHKVTKRDVDREIEKMKE